MSILSLRPGVGGISGRLYKLRGVREGRGGATESPTRERTKMTHLDRSTPNPTATELVANAKDCLLSALTLAGFSNVTASFEGGDGCGSITHIRTRRHGDQGSTLLTRDEGRGARGVIAQLMVAFTWHVVGAQYPGCLDSEGMDGDLDVDVGSGSVGVRITIRRSTTETFSHAL